MAHGTRFEAMAHGTRSLSFVAAGASVCLAYASLALASGTPIWLLHKDDGVEVANSRLACLVEHRTGAETNALICFVETQIHSYRKRPRSYVLVLGTHGLGVVDSQAHDVLLRYQPRLSGAPSDVKRAVTLIGGVGQLAEEDEGFVVAGTNIECHSSFQTAPTLICGVQGPDGRLPLGSYYALMTANGLGIFRVEANKAKAVFIKRQP